MTQDERSKLLNALHFIVRNETFAVNRAALLIQAELDKGWQDTDHQVMWEAASSVLSHSANLSKVFWPPKARSDKKIAARGELMRSEFDVADQSPLANRKVRNGFEHLDERVHEWLAETKGDLRSQVGEQLARIAWAYDLEIDDQLARILPPNDDEGDPSWLVDFDRD